MPIDPMGPLFFAVFFGLIFFLYGGWALFTHRLPKHWPRGGRWRL